VLRTCLVKTKQTKAFDIKLNYDVKYMILLTQRYIHATKIISQPIK